jgi:hypothetical protein
VFAAVDHDTLRKRRRRRPSSSPRRSQDLVTLVSPRRSRMPKVTSKGANWTAPATFSDYRCQEATLVQGKSAILRQRRRSESAMTKKDGQDRTSQDYDIQPH